MSKAKINIITEDTEVKFKEYEDLSFLDYGGYNVELYAWVKLRSLLTMRTKTVNTSALITKLFTWIQLKKFKILAVTTLRTREPLRA